MKLSLYPTITGAGLDVADLFVLVDVSAVATKVITFGELKSVMGAPGGADQQVQFNDAGAFGGNPGFVFDKTTGVLMLGPAGGIRVNHPDATTSWLPYPGDNQFYFRQPVNFTTGISVPGSSIFGAGSIVAGCLLTVRAGGPTDIPLIVMGAALQTGNLFEARNSSGGTAYTYLTSNFDFVTANKIQTGLYGATNGILSVVGTGGGLYVGNHGDSSDAPFQVDAGTGNVTATGNISSPFGGAGSARNERFGSGAGNSTATGTDNVVVGYLAGQSLTTGVSNVVFGSEAGNAITTGQANVAIGRLALGAVTTANFCVAVGHGSLSAATGTGNVGIGEVAAPNATGDYNTAIGLYGLNNLSSGTQNVAIGVNAGRFTLAAGSYNTLIGPGTDTLAAGTNYGIALGYGAIAGDGELALSPNVTTVSLTGKNVTISPSSLSNVPLTVQGVVGQSAVLAQLKGVSSTAAVRQQVDIDTAWADSTDASRKARFILRVWDTAAREAIRAEATGTGATVKVCGVVNVGEDGSVSLSNSSSAALKVEQTGVFNNLLRVDTLNGAVGIGAAPSLSSFLSVQGYTASPTSLPSPGDAKSVIISGATGAQSTNTSSNGGGTGGRFTLTGGTGGTPVAATTSVGGSGGELLASGGTAGGVSGTTDSTGGNGGDCTFQGGIALGSATGSNSNTGGNGGTITFRGTAGGQALNGATAIGGNGSPITVTSGAGGDAQDSTAVTTGGDAGLISFVAGNGGNGSAFSGTVVGGKGGSLTFSAGKGGFGLGGPNGVNGGIAFNINGTNQSPTASEWFIASAGTKMIRVNANGFSIFGVAPVAQPSGTGETVGFTSGSGTAVHDDSTFTGNIGSTAYRMNDVVKALKLLGALAM